MAFSAQKTAKIAAKLTRRRLPKTYRTVLFGSWAKGTATKTSDIDIGIVGSRSVPLVVMHAIREDLESIRTLRKIELVDLQRTSKSFKKKVLEHARPI